MMEGGKMGTEKKNEKCGEKIIKWLRGEVIEAGCVVK